METLTITAASLEDAPLVYDIMQKAFAEYLGVLTPPSGAHAEIVDDVIRVMGEGGAILAWLGDQAVGSARYAFHDDGRTCYVGRVAVLREYRGRGIASAMMGHIERIARAQGCAAMEIGVRMVLESNIRLYQRLGYRIASIYEHPKGGGMVATMVKTL